MNRKTSRARSATVKDIAQLAEVSTATVSRAFKQPDLVSKDTRQRIEKAAKRLRYHGNALASNLRRQRSDTIVVVVPFISNPFFSTVVQGIENVAHQQGYKVLLGESQENQARLDSYCAMLSRKEADGLILLGSLLPTDVRSAIKDGTDASIPLVMACEYFDGLNSPNVVIDNVQAAMTATDHLIELGHHRIATVTGPMKNPLSKDRLQGFLRSMKKSQIAVPPEYIAKGDFSVDCGYKAMKRLLELKRPPTALFCANDEMAIGAIHAIRENGLTIPGDLSVIGFDNIRFSEHCYPPLTTISQPQFEIGETAMKLMLDVFAKRRAATKVVLPHSLLLRNSTGAPRTK